MQITSRQLKTWSKLGQRACFGLAALEIAKQHDNFIMLTSDTSTSAGLERFKNTYPDKFIDVGIAEQNLIGIASGLASEGNNVFTATFSPFQILRCCEQIKVNLGYMKQPVKMVGLASGLCLSKLGYTHCSIEDMAIARAIPEITVISPCDPGQVVKASLAASNLNKPVYIRLTGDTKNEPVYLEDFNFEIGKANILHTGAHITIIATGTMVATALKVRELLSEKKLLVGVIDMHTIKPIDVLAIQNSCAHTKLLVTLEEHSLIGGLGSAVAEIVASLEDSPPLLPLGLADGYYGIGSYRDMLTLQGLSPELISKTIGRAFVNI